MVELKALQQSLQYFYQEDDLTRNYTYLQSLPKHKVHCELKFKSDMLIAGIDFFKQSFYYLDSGIDLSMLDEWERVEVQKSEKKQVEFELPLNIAITGERIALNLLQRASSIATYTKKFVDKVENYPIKILDTRKTTPGLRFLEKYAVQAGGGYNHRFGQLDMFMIKDNHKNSLGGAKKAIDFFRNLNSMYTPLMMEIHNLEELEIAIENNIKHVMLDNFSNEMILKAVSIKPKEMTYEISGGVRLHTIEEYLIDGIDAISIGALTYDAPAVDISLKYHGG